MNFLAGLAWREQPHAATSTTWLVPLHLAAGPLGVVGHVCFQLARAFPHAALVQHGERHYLLVRTTNFVSGGHVTGRAATALKGSGSTAEAARPLDAFDAETFGWRELPLTRADAAPHLDYTHLQPGERDLTEAERLRYFEDLEAATQAAEVEQARAEAALASGQLLALDDDPRPCVDGQLALAATHSSELACLERFIVCERPHSLADRPPLAAAASGQWFTPPPPDLMLTGVARMHRRHEWVMWRFRALGVALRPLPCDFPAYFWGYMQVAPNVSAKSALKAARESFKAWAGQAVELGALPKHARELAESLLHGRAVRYCLRPECQRHASELHGNRFCSSGCAGRACHRCAHPLEPCDAGPLAAPGFRRAARDVVAARRRLSLLRSLPFDAAAHWARLCGCSPPGVVDAQTCASCAELLRVGLALEEVAEELRRGGRSLETSLADAERLLHSAEGRLAAEGARRATRYACTRCPKRGKASGGIEERVTQQEELLKSTKLSWEQKAIVRLWRPEAARPLPLRLCLALGSGRALTAAERLELRAQQWRAQRSGGLLGAT